MNKQNDFFKRLGQNPVIVVLRAPSPDIALKCIQACHAGGLRNIEVTLSTPDAVEVLRESKKKYSDLNLGFGTVTNLDEARQTDIPEASFIVSPHTQDDLLEFYQNKEKTYIPGASTTSELMYLHNRGFSIQKLFPGSLYGPSGVAGILAPLPMLNLIVTGGVQLDNAAHYLEKGAKAICVGSNLIKKDWLQEHNFAAMTEEASRWSQMTCN